MSSGGVHNYNIKSFLLELGHALSSDGDRVGLRVRAEVCDFGLRRGLTGLIESTGTEGVRTDDGRLESTLLVVDSELGTCCRFTVTLHPILSSSKVKAACYGRVRT